MSNKPEYRWIPIDAVLRGDCIHTTARLRCLCTDINKIKKTALDSYLPDAINRNDVVGNITLAMRHLEDAEHRLDRALRALQPCPAKQPGPVEQVLDKTMASFPPCVVEDSRVPDPPPVCDSKSYSP